MGKKKYYMVIDTETANGRMVYDFGITVIDRAGNVVDTMSYVCAEFMNDPNSVNLLTDMFAKHRIAWYYYNLFANTDAFEVMPFAEIMTIMNALCEKYDATLCAYNAAFDKDALDKTAKYFGYEKFFTTDAEWQDIWNMAMSVLCNSRNYLKFCKSNGLETERGNIQTGAEAIYRYLCNNPHFEEKHTAYEDTKIEAAILTTVIKRKKKTDTAIVGNCLGNKNWQVITNRYKTKYSKE